MAVVGVVSNQVFMPAEAVLEACYPLGDKYNSRTEKRTAVRRVMIEGWSYTSAARGVDCQKPGEDGAKAECSAHTVMRWVADTEERVGHAQAWMQEAGANF